MNKAKQDSLLGIVFFLGLAFLLWATLALTDLTFEEPQRIEVFADNAGGLRSGDPVFVLGNRIGQVDAIDYQRQQPDPSRRVRLVLELKDPLTLQRDATIEIAAVNLLGGKVIEIDPGLEDELWPVNSPYIARLKVGGIDALGELLDDPQVKADFTRILAAVREVVDQLTKSESTLGRLINQSDLYDEFLATVESARNSLTELEKGESPLGRLIYNKDDGDKLASALDHVDSIAKKIDEGEGLLGRIINDGELASKADRLVTDAADIVTDAKAGKGTVGRLLRDEGLADEVEATIESFRAFADAARDPEAGLVGALVSDPKLRETGAKILTDVGEIVADIREGNGLLARLINDEELGEQFERILNQVSRAIEDAREAAPVGTFFQVLSGAF